MVNIQACLRDPSTERSKGGQAGTKGGSDKPERKLRRGTQSCSEELLVGLSPERVVLSSAGKSIENFWAFLQK